MFPANGANKLLERKLEFSSTAEPGAMDPVTGAINIAAPDALKAQQSIAVELGPDLFQFIRKANDGFCAQAPDHSKWPSILRPFIRSDKLHLVPGLDDSVRKAL